MKTTNKLATLMLVAVAMLVLAACAVPIAPATTDSTSSAPAATEVAGEEPAPAELPVVTVGTNAEYQPFEFVDESGAIVGFDIDLMTEVAARAGFTPNFVNTRWDGIFVALASGEFDTVISAVTITPERQETVDFSDPYFNAGQGIAVQASNETIAGPDDLVAGVSVGVQGGTTGDIWLTDNTDADVNRFEENPLAVQALAAGDVDAVVADFPTLADILMQNPELNLKLVGEPFTEELYGIAIRQGQPELVASLNAALASIVEDGTYDVLLEKWFGTSE